MPIAPGSRLGGYEILSVLGAGGMGEVYRGRDTKLGREVAIKVILDVFASDPDRVARFEREAKVLASLNHPHIAALYGMEQSGAQHFLVMELVEGQTLAERLLRGPMAIEETLALALQIADALEGAHEKGIVHRDLKPANVKVTPDDRVKVLDFGLAKAMESESAPSSVANSPTLSMMASQVGVILGTAAYMSPEQVKGLPADHRSDVFSFGAVLFEMLTGRQPFQGDTAPEVLASVLIREPEIARLPPDLNPRLIDLVRRCLEKQPKRRWQAIGDVRAELEAIAAAPRAQPSTAHAAVAPRSLWRRMMPAIVSALLVGALAAAAAWTLKPAPAAPAAPVIRFSFALPAGQRFTALARRLMAISPDGSVIAYAAAGRIYLRPIRDLQGSPLAGTEAGESAPAFSPDSKSLAFYAINEGAIKRIALSGGAAVTVCPAANLSNLDWGANGIVFGQGVGEHQVLRVSASGGTPQILLKLQPNEFPDGPQLLPDGDTVLFTLATGTRVGADRWDKAQVVAQSVKSGVRTLVVDGGSGARYLPTGHVAYAIGGTVYAKAFDLRTLAVSGEAFPILEGVRRSLSGGTGIADFSVSDNGTLAYIPGPAGTSSGMALAMADWQGALTPVKLSPGPYSAPRVSPDGTHVALESQDARETYIGIYDRDGTAALRRITSGGNSNSPVWSADGKRVAFQSSRDGDFAIFSQAVDGTGAPARLTKPAAGDVHVPQSWHGDVLLFDVIARDQISLWQVSVKDRQAAPFGGVHSSTETGATFSPDGHWVAYSATEQGVTNLFVQPFPATGQTYPLVKTRSSSPRHPIWSPEGTALIYGPGSGRIERIAVTARPTLTFGNPENVPRPFQGGPTGSRRMFDMLPDGRILGLVTPGQASGSPLQDEIHVVVNWFEELKARVPR